MLRRPPTNLNRQSQDATILLIREVLAKGIELSEVCLEIFSGVESIIKQSHRYMSMHWAQRPHMKNTYLLYSQE